MMKEEQVLLIEDEEINTKCVCCGKDAKYRLYFGRQY